MSVQAMGWVFDQSETTGSDRLVMLALANHAGARCTDGAYEAYPGIDLIAKEAKLNRRVTQNVVSRLAAAGHITVVINGAPDTRMRADRRTNLYRIHGVQPDDTPSTPDGVQPDDTPQDPERGAASEHNGVQHQNVTGCSATAPKPSLEPSLNQPPLPPQALGPASEPDTAGGSTIDQQQPEHPPAITGDQRRVRIHEATTLIATRLARTATGLARPGQWIGAVAERLDGEHAEAGHRLLAEHPDLTPVALADLLERPPEDHAARERARQAEADTQRLLRDKLTTTDAERARVAGDIRRLREQVRQPYRQDEPA